MCIPIIRVQVFPVKDTFNSTTFKDILGSRAIPTWWKLFRESTLSVPLWLCSKPTSWRHGLTSWCGETWVGYTEPLPQFYWTPLGSIRMMIASQVFLSNINSQPHKCCYCRIGTIDHFPRSCGKPSQKEGAAIATKGRGIQKHFTI